MTRPAKGPTTAEIQARAAVRFKLYDIIDNFFRYGWKYGSFAFGAWCAKEVLVAFSGHVTFADINIHALGSVEVSRVLHWVATVGLAIWGLIERRLRQRTIQRLAPRLAEFEKGVDPNRTSSHLTERGTTRKEDRL